MILRSNSAQLPTKFGSFRIIVWPGEKGKEATMLLTPQLDVTKPVLVRVHSECLTGDTFGSLRCDCGQQKEKALELISESQNGIFIYLRQEGRGIGIAEKIKAYILQDQGYDTHEANILLGHEPDQREYSVVKDILQKLRVKKMQLITNNPSKVNAIRELGFTITSDIPLKIKSNRYNKRYLETKKIKFKHFDKRFNSRYYLGVCGVANIEDIKTISEFVKQYSSDPFLRIGIGITATHALLTNAKEAAKIESLVKTTKKHFPPLVPIVHFSFKNSSDYLGDIRIMAKRFPASTRIILNDIEKDHLKVFTYATKHFKVHFPLTTPMMKLLDDPRFVRVVKNHKVIVLLDDSGGKGLREEKKSFQQKINKCLAKGVNDIGLVGGFGPDTLEIYLDLKNYYKINFSIDAETNLYRNGRLNMVKVKKYLDKLLTPAE